MKTNSKFKYLIIVLNDKPVTCLSYMHIKPNNHDSASKILSITNIGSRYRSTQVDIGCIASQVGCMSRPNVHYSQPLLVTAFYPYQLRTIYIYIFHLYFSKSNVQSQYIQQSRIYYNIYKKSCIRKVHYQQKSHLLLPHRFFLSLGVFLCISF